MPTTSQLPFGLRVPLKLAGGQRRFDDVNVQLGTGELRRRSWIVDAGSAMGTSPVHVAVARRRGGMT